MRRILATTIILTLSHLLNAQCSDRLSEVNTISNSSRSSEKQRLSNLETGSSRFTYGEEEDDYFRLLPIKGIWLGGFDSDGDLHFAASDYLSDFGPGPIWHNIDNYSKHCEFFQRVWTISHEDIQTFRQKFADGYTSEANTPKDILEWPALGNPHIIPHNKKALAPFFDYNLDGMYNPIDDYY